MAGSPTVGRVNWSAVDAALFDLDGVLTPTAEVHMRAWSLMFDAFLARRGLPGRFTDADYFTYVDGKPRHDAVRAFLASRGIELPEGTPADPPDAETVWGLGNLKNADFLETLEREGIAAYPDAQRLLEWLEQRGVRTAVVSSSRNAGAVLAAAGLAERLPVVVDGLVAHAEGLPGKPAPDTYAYAADLLGVPHGRAVVVEDALSGVAAGRAGGFAAVVGVDRGAGAGALLRAGADVVVSDLDELVPEG